MLDLEDAEGGLTDDRVGGIRSKHDQTNLFQRRGERVTDAHRPPDGTVGAPRVRSTATRRLPTVQTMMAY